jgi:hypothetical protein
VIQIYAMSQSKTDNPEPVGYHDLL